MTPDFRTSFLRDLKRIKDQALHQRIQKAIEEIEAAADLGAVKNLAKLEGGKNCYRVRVGDYRIGIMVQGDVVSFARCLHRREIYKVFP